MKALGRVVLLFGALALAGATGCSNKEKETQKANDPVSIHKEAGDKLLTAGEFSKAAQEYGQALQVDPKQEKLWEKKAFAHQQAGELDQYDEAFVKMLEFKPEVSQKAEMLRGLAGMYMQKQALDKAEKYFGEAVKLEPNDALSLSWIGEIYSRRGGARDPKAEAVPEHLDKALSYYDKVIAIKPEDPVPYVNKRVIMNKYMAHERKAKEADEELLKKVKIKDKVEEIKASAEKHQARMDELKKQSDEISAKVAELQKKNPPVKK